MDHQVTRKGQVTIPKKLRLKHNITKGSQIEFEDAGDCIIMRKTVNFLDLLGSGSEHSTPEKMNQLLNEFRKQDA
ncbi:MAG: AbrB/MazE/SpoVT family DNA-binding domain-containing protein [Candidatus Bathyarchaeota archaeon]|nr:AbrB/MazE/SpoVT family DNA-binding domain-containing protein [Candidatus Bathyarchaeota archaeon]